MKHIHWGLLAALTLGAPCLAEERMSTGKQVFDKWCAACHAPGHRIPGTASLAAKYGAEKPAALEERADLNPAFVAYFVRHGILTMPPFRKTEITDAELALLAGYLAREAR